MKEFRRLVDGFREAGGVVIMGPGTTIVDTPAPGHETDDIRQRYIDAFVRNHENRLVIDAQKECFMHLEAGGYLN